MILYNINNINHILLLNIEHKFLIYAEIKQVIIMKGMKAA